MLNQKELIKKVKNYNKFLNPDTLSKAYKFAVNAHKNQKRDEGKPYIIHPVAVASILTDLKACKNIFLISTHLTTLWYPECKGCTFFQKSQNRDVDVSNEKSDIRDSKHIP